MGKAVCLLAISLVLTASGCASFRVGGQVQSGRQALLIDQPETALGYFQQAAQTDPDYIFESVNFRESIWTYVGRAQYAQGKWPEARRSFERALSVYRDDPSAQLYLGLAMIRQGEQARGMEQVQRGMKNLAVWIDYLNGANPFYAFWDPNGEIRKEIAKTLNEMENEKVESAKAILASAEWVGRQMEEEIDRVRGDERRQFNREHERDRRGLGIGVGIGF